MKQVLIAAIGILALAIAILSFYSVTVFDIAYPLKHPIRFVIETLFAGLIPTIFFVVIYWFRKEPIYKNTAVFVVTFLKFIVLQLVCQFSGLYTAIFQYKI